MTSSTQPAAQNKQSSPGLWPSLAPYVVPPVAAAAAISFPSVMRGMVMKSALQRGEPLPTMTMVEGVKAGMNAAPSIAAIVGTQMLLQKAFVGDSEKVSFTSTLASSAAVGFVSSPALAVFNGYTAKEPMRAMQSLQKLTLKQAGAIAGQETGFVLGLAGADLLAVPMKQVFGDNKPVEYVAACTSGALGSLVGHPGNTALTRWQSTLKVENLCQLTWGTLRKARANAVFACVYKGAKELLMPVNEDKKKNTQ